MRRSRAVLAAFVGAVVFVACRDQDVTTFPLHRPLPHAGFDIDPLGSVSGVIGGTNNPFGVTESQLADYPATGKMMLDSLAYANIGWIRLPIDWYTVQPNSATDWVDDVVRKVDSTALWAQQRGINVLLAVNTSSPSWATDDSLTCPPDSLHITAWRNYVGAIVQTFKQYGVHTYAISNEPDALNESVSGNMKCPRENWIARGQRALQAAADTIQKADNSGRVVAYELSSAATNAQLDSVNKSLLHVDSLLSRRIDVLGVHKYDYAAAAFDFMNSQISTYVPNREVWLTEVDLGANASERDQRNYMSVLISKFGHDHSPESIYKTNSNWTKTFIWRMAGETGDTRVLFDNGWQSDPGQLRARQQWYAYKFFTTTYPSYASGGLPSYYYWGYHWDPASSTGTWEMRSDAEPSLGVSGNGAHYYSYMFSLHPSLVRAGMSICDTTTFGYIVGPYGACNGDHAGPFTYDSYDHSVQQLQLTLDTNALPGPASNDRLGPSGLVRLQACFRVSYYDPSTVYGWDLARTNFCDQSSLSTKLSTTGWIDAIAFWLNGDLR